MFNGTYEPSTSDWVAEQVERYEASGGTEANTLRETGIPVIIVTTEGRHSGLVRKFALMRVEHEGQYALVASKGGAPDNPDWYHNLMARPEVLIQDGPEPAPYDLHVASGDERATWWDRSVAVFAPYAEYAERTDREIPILIAVPR